MATGTLPLLSVTEIISNFIDTSWFKPEHAQRGTAVHSICEDIAVTTKYPAKMPKEYELYANCFSYWWFFEPGARVVVAHENELIDKDLGIIGHPDLILADKKEVVKGSELTLIDLKTSKQAYPWWRLQLAAYVYMYNRKSHNKITKYGSLRVRQGKKALYNSYEDSYEDDLKTFKSILTTIRFFKLIKEGRYDWKQ